MGSGLAGASCTGFFLTSEDYNTFTVLGALLGVTLSATIGGLAGFHLWGMFANKTTLEVKRFREIKLFDVEDTFKNFKQVFGDNFIGYFLPVPTWGTLDGLDYPYLEANFKGTERNEKEEEI
jgi:hypothetical protein